jgi:hypothetical protein
MRTNRITGSGEITTEDVEEVIHCHPGSNDDPDGD